MGGALSFFPGARDFLAVPVNYDGAKAVRGTERDRKPTVSGNGRHDSFWQDRDKQKRQQQENSCQLPYPFLYPSDRPHRPEPLNSIRMIPYPV